MAFIVLSKLRRICRAPVVFNPAFVYALTDGDISVKNCPTVRAQKRRTFLYTGGEFGAVFGINADATARIGTLESRVEPCQQVRGSMAVFHNPPHTGSPPSVETNEQ